MGGRTSGRVGDIAIWRAVAGKQAVRRPGGLVCEMGGRAGEEGRSSSRRADRRQDGRREGGRRKGGRLKSG